MDSWNGGSGREIGVTLLLHELSGDDRFEIAGRLRHSAVRVETIFVATAIAERSIPVERVDVAAIKLTAEPAGLVFAAELAQRVPWVQVVFWASDESPAAATTAHLARTLGLSRVVPMSAAASWLASAIVPLTRLSRARRMAIEAEATIPSLPAMSSRVVPPTMALPEAERQFRESYLRRLLSESPSAKQAAERAGVPYTTLCSMMKKLGLSKRSLSS